MGPTLSEKCAAKPVSASVQCALRNSLNGKRFMNDQPESTVQRQIEAYNRHDLEDFLSAYSPDAQILKFPAGEVLMNDLEEIRANYREWLGADSALHAEIVSRIVQGNYVIDKERISGMIENKIVEAAVIYEVKENLITKVWLILET